MKGLAIASLVLGIIGFLFPFVAVLGIASIPFGFLVFPYRAVSLLELLISALAVILGFFPLIKKILRAMAITGIVLGLLGSLFSFGFISLKPEDIMKQTTKEITQKEQKKPTKGKTQDKVSTEEQKKPTEEVTQEREEKPIETVLKLGEGVRIDELLITFESARITKTYAEGKYFTLTPKSGYKFVVVKVAGENVGKKRGYILQSGGTIEVDKGYIYNSKVGYLHFNLLPEEKGSNELAFEILESTNPVRLHTEIKGKQYTVDIARAEESNEDSTNEPSEKLSTSQSKTPQKHISGNPFGLSTLSGSSHKKASTQESTTGSGIYKWVDKNGVTHVTNDINSIPPEYQDKLINER